jgi:intracellular multiplication protein IcmJ
MHDPLAEDADEAFCKLRSDVFNRDGGICQGCQTQTRMPAQTIGGTLRGMGRFEVHHIDDDHHNNRIDNLILLCPFCHNVFHCGNAGHRAAGVLIDAPWITQADLNALTHVLFRLMVPPSASASAPRRAGGSLSASPALSEQEVDKLKSIAQEAERRYRALESLREGVDRRFGHGMSDPANFARALMQLHKEDPARYADRARFLGGVRLLASFEYFTAPPPGPKSYSPVVYWKNAFEARQHEGLQLSQFFEEWMASVKQVAGIVE